MADNKIEVHEYALMFPPASALELEQMAEDIAARGLVNAIVTLDGKVLDGRNRMKACEIAGVDPRFVKYSGGDPLGDVISWNLHRRHLSVSQLAALATKLKEAYAEEAKARQGARNDLVANLPQCFTCRVCHEQFSAEVWHCKECGHHWPMTVESCSNCHKQDAPKRPDAKRDPGQKARDQAAAAVGVSPRIVQDAEFVKKRAPDVFARIGTKDNEGREFTVHAAKKEVENKVRKTDPLDTTKDVEEKRDKDSAALYHLKRYWRQATKKDKKAFRGWINENND
jgi:hypothetical protein